MRTVGPMEMMVLALAGVFLLLFVIPYWKVFSKAGYPGAMAIVMVVPVVNIGMLFFLGFSQWPVLKELEDLRRRSPQAQ